ncbi:MAG: response regulator [Desulfobacteraceae bacterium]|jgi:response regulator RpfG family c-di-GMP phosphodiesterase
MPESNHIVLCVDDEKNILSAMKRLLRKETFRLLTCSSGEEALSLMAENDVHVVISDQRMPKMNGTEFLRLVKDKYPDVIRIILTGYTDVDSITESINEGHIYKFFLKPWNDQNLKLEIRQALEQFDLIKANRQLHEKILKQNEELRAMNENLEELVRERTQSLEIQNQALQISHSILEDLPLPIIGVSAEKMVVLINQAAQRLFGEAQLIGIGENVAETLPAGFEALVEETLRCDVPIHLKKKKIYNEYYDLDLVPLTGRFKGKGVVITLEPTVE